MRVQLLLLSYSRQASPIHEKGGRKTMKKLMWVCTGPRVSSRTSVTGADGHCPVADTCAASY